MQPPANGNGAGRSLAPIEQVGQQLEQMTGKLAVALPKHIPVERFKRVVLTALNLNPDLLNADRRSLFNAASKAASDGLMPDGREGALVVFKDWKTQREMIQWMPMTFGILKKLRQSGEIASVSARCVYQNEIDQGRFEYRIADGEEHLRHDPILVGDRGKLVLVYATAKFRDGTVQNEPLTASDIAKIRAVSKTGKSERGPWAQWEDEMWRKSALRRLSKYLPLSAEDHRMLDHDFADTEAEQIRSEVRAEPQSIAHAAASLGAAVDIEPAHDAETGEILESGTETPPVDQTDEIAVPITDLHPREGGGHDYARFHKDALAQIATLDPVDVLPWLDAHAEKIAGCRQAKKAWADEIGAAAKERMSAA